MDNPPEHWDVAILSTGLTESILAAALSKAGVKVLHLDENDYYGAESASLTLRELVAWADCHKPSTEAYVGRFSQISSSLPSEMNPSTASEALFKESRSFSISLSPSLIPARGPLIDSLIGSGVSRYGGFCMLNGLAIAMESNGAWSFKRAPSNKEDIFKDRSMSLIEKRKLMKFLMFAGGQADISNESQDDVGFVNLLMDQYGLSPQIVDGLAYAIAQCNSPDEKAASALFRMRRYLQSAGRYGRSAFLIGHYGGTGEVAQGFCRAAAVHGATYILGRKIEAISHSNKPSTKPIISEEAPERRPSGSHYSIQLGGFQHPVTADYVITTSPLSTGTDPHGNFIPSEHYLMRGIAILDKPVSLISEAPGTEALPREGLEQDNMLIVFTPHSGSDASIRVDKPVSALVLGESSMSCPSGKYLVYLSTVWKCEPPLNGVPDPRDVLEPFLQIILSANNSGGVEGRIEALYTLFYNERMPSQSRDKQSSDGTFRIYSGPSLEAHMSETVDMAALEAEATYRALMTKLDRSGQEDSERPIWPPQSNEADEDSAAADEW